MSAPGKIGRLVYRCRLCGLVDESIGVPDVATALVTIAHDGSTAKLNWGGIIASLTCLHVCGENTTGVSDLIGGRQDA